MSKPKFTPGPWKAGKNPYMTTVLDGHEGKAIYPKNGSPHIAWANAENEDGEIDMQTALANACLIATAPEMFAFLEKIVNQIEENGLMQYDVIHNGETWVLEEAKELLRKARGESEMSE